MNRLTTSLIAALAFFAAITSFAQTAPPLPPLPNGEVLNVWPFSGSNYLSLRRSAPLTVTNVALVPTWAGNGLQVDSPDPAAITYAVIETNGHTNLDLTQGTIEMWFSPDWSSSDGLGNWGTILEVGSWSTNLDEASGAWGLYISPDASTLCFSAQTNGGMTNYLNAPIAWNAGEWHHIVLTYSATNSLLYLEGQFVTNGPGISIVPGANVLSNGFSIGSDGYATAMLQAAGIFNFVTTYNYQLDADTIAEDYADDSQNVSPLPSGGFGNNGFTMDDPPSPGGTGSGTNSGSGGPSFNSPQYTTNDFYLQVLPLGTNIFNSDSNSITVLLMGTFPEIAYQIFTTTNLQGTNTVWTLEQNLIGADGTNVTPTTISMLGRSNLFIQGLAYGLDSDGDGLPDWWQLKYFGHLGVDPYGDPAGDGWNNLQKYQLGMNPNVVYPPPAPAGFVGTMDTNGNVSLHWPAATNLPSGGAGAVTGYTIAIPGWTTNTVSASQTSYNDLIANDPMLQTFFQTVTNAYYLSWSAPTYTLQVNYANITSQASTADLSAEYFQNVRFGQQFSVQAYMVRGPRGQMNLVVSDMPTNVAAIRVYYSTDMSEAIYPKNTAYLLPQGVLNISDGFFDVPASSFTNSVALISDSQLPLYGLYQFVLFPIATDGSLGSPTYNFIGWPGAFAGPQVANIPFMDGRTNIAQNLAFWLRAADGGESFSFNVIDANTDISQISGPSTFAYAGFHTPYTPSSYYWGNYTDTQINEFNPFEENYLLRNFALSSTNVVSDGELAGVFASIWDFYPNHVGVFITNLPPSMFNTYQYTLAGSRASVPSVLSAANTQWLESWPDYLGHLDPIDYGNSALAYIGIEGNQNFYMTNNATNIFGLPYLAAQYEYTNTNSIGLQDQTIYAGGASVSNYSGYFYPETAQPQLQTVSYYFGRPLNASWISDPLPINGDAGFSITNTTPYPFIAAFAKPFIVSGWAQQAVGYNGNPTGAIGYAEQYFDQAYLADSSGNMTTNSAGILSEYGEFFPTQPGTALLTTKPDAATGSTGQCVVNVMKLQLDVNHDGVMDLSFFGPDNTSPDKPFVFWNNNNFDRSTLDSADEVYYDDDILAGGDEGSPNLPVADNNYAIIAPFQQPYRVIPCKRDLQDFARLWVVGLSNVVTNLPSGYTVSLVWEDYAGTPFSNDPTIDIFQAADSDGGTGYLTNSTIAAQQINRTNFAYVGRLAPYGAIQLNSSQFSNSWAGDHFIWCGVAPGTGQLGLRINDTNGNPVVETFAYIQVKDIKDMYERWTVGDNLNVAPTNAPVLACNDLPQGDTQSFQYPQPTDPNTPYILYVHGWNMQAWEKDRFAESAFKRLYWQGYQGRLGIFRWPTGNNFSGGVLQSWNNPVTDRRNYDNSEFVAWNSAVGLTNLLTQLNSEYPGHVYMLAHSMGNVVAGEALRLAGSTQLVNTYVASQAAIPAHVYDGTVTNSIFTSSDPVTPNIYSNWLASNSGAVGRRINFYNTNDYALALARWGLNQRLKPDFGIVSWNYLFEGYPYDGTQTYTPGSIDDSPPWNYFAKNDIISTVIFDVVGNVTNRYEVMAYAAQARSTALGMTAGILQNLEGFVDLGRSQNPRIWPPDTNPLFGENPYAEHFYHSAEFRGDYDQQQGYWSELLGTEAFQLK